MPFDKITDARKAAQHESQSARQIADAQMQKAGFTRSAGFEPSARARNPYQAEADRPAPLEPSAPLDLSKAGEPKTKRRSFGVGEGD
jgi:hypothetical protein